MNKIIVASILSMLSLSAFATEGFDVEKKWKSCTACHGQKAEKHAMGKSKVIANMSKEDITTALKGYKDGSYGGPMKGVMKGQVIRMDDADIEKTAKYINSNFGKK